MGLTKRTFDEMEVGEQAPAAIFVWAEKKKGEGCGSPFQKRAVTQEQATSTERARHQRSQSRNHRRSSYMSCTAPLLLFLACLPDNHVFCVEQRGDVIRMIVRSCHSDEQSRERSNRSSKSRHQPLQSLVLRLTLLLVGGLAALWLLPAHIVQGPAGSPEPLQVTHANGGAAQSSLPGLTPTCGHPKEVLKALGLPLDKVTP